MARTNPNRLTWALVVQPCERPGESAIVQAMNKRDENRLRAALPHCPQPENMVVSWVRDQTQHGHRCGLIDAAVRMDWAPAISILHAAGLPVSRETLEYATRKKRASCVKRLLDLGLPPNGQPGFPPLRFLSADRIDPEQHATQARIARHYCKAGANPWADSQNDKRETYTLLEVMLQKGLLSVARVLLDSAHARNLPPPADMTQDPARAWVALSQAFHPYLAHPSSNALCLAAPAMLSTLDAMRSTFGDPSRQLLDTTWQQATLALEARPTRGLEGLHALGQGLVQRFPQDTDFHLSMARFFQEHFHRVPPEIGSYWQQVQLQREVPASQGRVSRVRL